MNHNQVTNAPRHPYPSATEARPASEMSREMIDLREALGQLEKSIETLASKLQPLLAVRAESGKVEANALECSLVPLASEIRDFRKQVRRQEQRIAGLTEACEL